MEAQVRLLVDDVWERYLNTPEDNRLMIAIAGIPGSGKTNLSVRVTERLNERQSTLDPDSDPVAAFCPMDGYHWPRAVLDTFKDPEKAHARRGAEFTFDGASFLKLVQSLRVPLDKAMPQSVFAPSFDHAAKDPVDDDIEIKPNHRIVVFEGNYVCLDKEPWSKAAELMDLRWFVHVDREIARQRLAERHRQAGLAENKEAGLKRADENDLLNGDYLEEFMVSNIDKTVNSLEDAQWAPAEEKKGTT
ncbi:hypothetical protein AB5N19_09246 [Seiridium cardinale]